MTRYAIKTTAGYVAGIWPDGHLTYVEDTDFALTWATATETTVFMLAHNIDGTFVPVER